jgi:hypothetical protein
MRTRIMLALGVALLTAGLAQAQRPGQSQSQGAGPGMGQSLEPVPGQPQGSPPEPERWDPVSTTARAVTGRVGFAPDRIIFGNRASLPLEPAGQVADFSAEGQRVVATLYRVTQPGDPALVGGNRLCGGGRQCRTIAVWEPPPIGAEIPGRTRAMAVFSGPKAPRGTEEAGLCGTFFYELPRPAGR